MPGTAEDPALVHPGSVIGSSRLGRARDRAEADRGAGVRTVVSEGVEITVTIEDANPEPPARHDLSGAGREIFYAADADGHGQRTNADGGGVAGPPNSENP